MSFVPACTVDEVAADTAPRRSRSTAPSWPSSTRGGTFYAIADECSHAAIPLSEGDVGDGEIECYFHGSRFDLRTGKPLGLPATEPVAVYPCRVDDDDVLVDVDARPDHDLEPTELQES